MDTDNINVGIMVLVFAFLFFIIIGVVALISSGNLLQGTFKRDKDKIRDAMPLFCTILFNFYCIIHFLFVCLLKW